MMKASIPKQLLHQVILMLPNDCSTLKLKDNSNLFVPSNVIASKKKTVEQGGHPKGTTDAAVKELQQNVELAT
jgi:hypothetical protein